MDATVTILVRTPHGTFAEDVEVNDAHHAIERLGDGDGWKWVNSHHGHRERGKIETAAGWALVQAMRGEASHV